MGGTITHLVIADKIIRKLPPGIISDAGMFYAGNLAPDAIHAREGYVRAMKKHTHFRDDIWDRDFMKPESQEIYQKRLGAFTKTNAHRKGPMLDVYRGYISHILSDEIFVKTVRQKLVDMLEEEGIDQRDREFIHKFAPEVHNNDHILARSHPETGTIGGLLENAGPFEIEGYITAEEIDISKRWVLRNFLDESIRSREPEQPAYITPEDIEEYMNESADYAISYLKRQKFL